MTRKPPPPVLAVFDFFQDFEGFEGTSRISGAITTLLVQARGLKF